MPTRNLRLAVPLLAACSGTPQPDDAPAGLVIDEPPVVSQPAPSLAPPADARPGSRWVAPGIVDAHGHPASLGRHLSQLRLNDLGSLAETLEAVQQASSEGEGWLRGRGWDQNDWADLGEGRAWPTAADLDAVVPDRPVALRRVDGHATWVNSASLAAAGITAETPDPEGGRILRDAEGRPTGILVDAAASLLPAAAEPSPAERRRRLLLGLQTMVATGLTGVHDMGVSDEDLDIYEALDASSELQPRVWAYLDPDAQAVERLQAEGPWCGRRLCVVGVKMYVDGALGSRGALLSEDYADEPGSRGLQITPTADLQAMATRLLSVRAQLAVHAIGDEGVHQVMDAFAAARQAVPEAADVPLRVEHFQVARPEDLARLGPLGVVASMQPTHATSDMPWAEQRLGAERVGWSYAWRDVLDAGGLLAFGSDFPVEQVSPSFGLWAAVTRTDLQGAPDGGWRPEQRLGPELAARAFSEGAWQALGAEARGYPTVEDDRTVFVAQEGPAGQGLWWEAVQTVVDGEVVWSRR